MSEEKKKLKKSVHATISDESYNTICEYEQEFGSKSAVVDEALKAFKKLKKPHLASLREIWCRARDKNMLLVGKTTFLSYISGKTENVYKKNLAIESVEWYLGKRIEEMDLEEFLKGIKFIYHMANYFYQIELEKNDKGAFQMRFNHDLNEIYSTFWAGYFETLLRENFSCQVESFIRNESFYLIIKM